MKKILAKIFLSLYDQDSITQTCRNTGWISGAHFLKEMEALEYEQKNVHTNDQHF